MLSRKITLLPGRRPRNPETRRRETQRTSRRERNVSITPNPQQFLDYVRGDLSGEVMVLTS
jgi:hypothetical protein